jgi:hypothetical protein
MRGKKEIRKTIGKVQLFLGIIFLIGGFAGLAVGYNLMKTNLEINSQEFTNSLDSIQNIKEFSNETLFSGVLSTSIYHYGKNDFIRQNFINLALEMVLIIIISILFITQGLLNLPQEGY